MNWSGDAICLSGFSLLALTGGIVVGRTLLWQGIGNTWHAAVSSVLAAAALFLVHGLSRSTLQFWCAALVLLYAAAHDAATHTVPDHVHLLLLAAGLMHIPTPASSIAGFLLLPLPFLLAAWLAPGRVGGADIKLMAALGFLLGLWPGIAAAILGLALSVLSRLPFRKQPFALIPYLATGAFLVFLT